MQAIAITYENLGPEASLEIKELIKKESKIQGPALTFEADFKEIAALTYFSQSFSHVGLLLAEIKIKELDKLKISSELSKLLKEKLTFSVRCYSDSLDKQETEINIAEKLSEFFQKQNISLKVDLENPDFLFIFYEFKKKAYLFLDFAGISLDKRDYKVFPNRLDIKGTLAFLILRFAGFNGTQKILDPFSRSATIPIEAALYNTKISHNLFRKDRLAFNKFSISPKLLDKRIKPKKQIFAFDPQLKNINAARKNAKIADINKEISFSRVSIEDLDIKFNKEIDLICTFIPQQNRFNEKQIGKIYNEFFHQSGLILSNKGKMALLTLKTEILKKTAENHNFKLIKEIQTKAGKQQIFILLFERNQKA